MIVSNEDYKPTESKYKGGAREMYVAYDLEQNTRGDNTAVYPKVKRVYISGHVDDWKIGQVEKKSGREVYGIAINYEQKREGYHREGYTAERDGTKYEVEATDVEPSSQSFRKVVEIPEEAHNIKFYKEFDALPEKYRTALQDVA